MQNFTAGKILFTIVGVASVPALAAQEIEVNQVQLIEDLPISIRSQVYEKVFQFLTANPEISPSVSVAIDAKGILYVLDNKNIKLHSLGEPSCVVTNFSRNESGR